MKTTDWQSWSRLKRLDLRDLALALGNAAMHEINLWPVGGEGRGVKATSESILRLTDTHALGGFDRLYKEFASVLVELKSVSVNPFYTQIISKKAFSDRNGVRRVFRIAIENMIDDCGLFVRELSASFSESLNISPIVAEKIEKIVPDQKFGAILFKFYRGKLRVDHIKGSPVDGAEQISERARKRLVRDAKQLLEEFEGSNVDRRIMRLIADIADDLKNRQDIVQIGLSSFTISSYCNKFDKELSTFLTAQLHGFSIGLNHFVGQFEDWKTFIENSALADFSENDLQVIKNTATNFIKRLEELSENVQPEVPQSLRRIVDAIKGPRKASRKAAWAAIRAIENLVSLISHECVNILKSTFKGVNKGLERGTSIITVAGLLIGAASAIGELSPTVLVTMKAEWLAQLLKLLVK